jgi:hypothetical protein
MQDWVATGNIEVGNPVGFLAHVEAIFENGFDLRPGHFFKPEMIIFGKNVAMLASLVAAICYMPLESEVFHNDFPVI